MRHTLLIALLLFNSQVNAQDTVKLRPPYSVFVMPCQLLNGTYAGGFTVGTEFRLYHHFSMTLEGGPYFASGYMAKANLKYYLIPVEIVDNCEQAGYLALEYAYKKQRYSVEDYIEGANNSITDTSVNYSVYKFANSLTLKAGFTSSLLHRFYMDFYLGFGIRYRVVQNSLIAGQEGTLYHWNEGMKDNISNSNVRGYVPDFSLGWKIGYRCK